MARRKSCSVYVIALHNDVLLEAKFKKCNPNYVSGKPCVYVGMTGLDIDLRFDKHKAGIQSNRYVLLYGMHLLPDLYEGFNPMTYDEAILMEIDIGIDLRSAGFGVCWHSQSRARHSQSRLRPLYCENCQLVRRTKLGTSARIERSVVYYFYIVRLQQGSFGVRPRTVKFTEKSRRLVRGV